ncbi:zinc ribbon domain-containing protein [Enterococcus devriesei]|uniref:zinc ribbon domain-containing protein n=1 Tax=Enterococcus devriesei TaxID=319970 RepID=UPI00288FF288|nr:zinc ribbon domain-containing protein [Enterococcus devriesei]MDT2822910.1 zinc ribbon domain-containing protein [Enterococcus devriesei]
MEETVFCQSCGMPLTEGLYGTEHDGAKNTDYCLYCYKHGAFTDDHTMEEMIAISLKHMDQSGLLTEHGQTKEEAAKMMYDFFPELKRWKKYNENS